MLQNFWSSVFMRNSAKSTAEKKNIFFSFENLLQFSSFYQHEKNF